jgi:lantibiotic transport system ATP-binding protein
MTAIVTTKGLSKQYDKVFRVKDVDLCVPQGTVYGFLGPNGAGKTTTLKMILGLVHPTQGNINVFDETITAKNRMDMLKHVGSLIESPSYYGHLTGEENLHIFQTLRGFSSSEIERVLHIVRLEKQRKKLVKNYSLGMKQRLGLAIALLGNPQLLILDEPTNGLDPSGIHEIRELIITLPKQYGMTVLVSSHMLSEIDQIATHLGIIHSGELVFQGQLSALHAQSQRAIAIRTLNNALAFKVLQEKQVPVKLVDDYLLIPDLEEKVLAQYSTLLAANRVGLTRIELREKKLEDIFLELTGMAVSL